MTKIKLNLQKKSVLVIGTGLMAEQYFRVLNKLKILDVTILGNSLEKTRKLSKKYNYSQISGGYKKNLSEMTKKDLVIIVLPIPLILEAATLCLQYGHDNILLEKPGSLDIRSLRKFQKKIKKQNVRIGYNRLFYPSLEKLKTLVKKDGGINSCNFTITEWIDKINFKKYTKDVIQKWGIANSSHVISMVFDLIGFPKKITCYQTGKLPWHNSGSIFVGSGISNFAIPFSYFADWTSTGRWGIEIMTSKNSYKLQPLEELSVYSKNSNNWKKILLKKPYSKVKEGLSEEIIAMLNPKEKSFSNSVTLDKAIKTIQITEKIFGY